MDLATIHWPKGRRAVVSLTYDDGLPSHPRVVAPLLEKYHIRGTFYAPLKSDLSESPLMWREMVRRGHELGNHTVFHPCWSVDGKFKDWLQDDYNLENYDEKRWLDEVKTANEALTLVDGHNDRTFGNTCWNNYLGSKNEPICLEPLIEQVFIAARGVNLGKQVDLARINFNNLGTVWADGRTFDQFLPELENVLDMGGWIIYSFHGVGKEAHSLYIDPQEHLSLLEYLSRNSKQIWTAPVIDVVKFLK